MARRKTAPEPKPEPMIVSVTVLEPRQGGKDVSRAVVEQAYNDACAEAGRLLVHYRVKEAAPHCDAKLKRILTAQDSAALDRFVRAAVDSVFMWCMGEWARGASPGPKEALNAYTARQQAEKAEKLAVFLEKKGLKDNAAGQRMRAIELLELAKDLDRTQQNG